MAVSTGRHASRVAVNISLAVDALGRAYDNAQDAVCFEQNGPYLKKQLGYAIEKVNVAIALVHDFIVEKNEQPPVLLDQAELSRNGVPY